MTTENILYTDGHDVTVTESTFQVRKNFYRLEGITHHGFAIIKPNRVPAFIISGLGLLAVGLGISNLSPEINFSVNVYSYKLSVNTILLASGTLLILIGILISILMKERYGVRISTAEGDKDVVVSERREYVNMIVEALNQADMTTQHHKLEY